MQHQLAKLVAVLSVLSQWESVCDARAVFVTVFSVVQGDAAVACFGWQL
jgi:hypothetical protein